MPWRRERIAVVGSGPAGMSAAYQLARRGYHVALYEASDELGGVLRNGIPDYRLPKDVLDRELGYVLMLGVKRKRQVCRGRNRIPAELRL